ncbi:MAG: 30S ribosomal protein S8 [Firmicutes bacterium]|nr:30S ribosomal protein S8 [Bacillota bacterium]
MVTTDPIADLLTRIRNALVAKHKTVEVPVSRMKMQIAEILTNEGYIKSAEVVGGGVEKNILITLKYGAKNEKIISNLKRISKPGLRVYCTADEVPKVLNGLGIAILSTNKGVMTDKSARQCNVGGEVLAYVW